MIGRSTSECVVSSRSRPVVARGIFATEQPEDRRQDIGLGSGPDDNPARQPRRIDDQRDVMAQLGRRRAASLAVCGRHNHAMVAADDEDRGLRTTACSVHWRRTRRRLYPCSDRCSIATMWWLSICPTSVRSAFPLVGESSGNWNRIMVDDRQHHRRERLRQVIEGVDGVPHQCSVGETPARGGIALRKVAAIDRRDAV